MLNATLYTAFYQIGGRKMQKDLVEEFEALEEAYNEYVTECECAICILQAKLDNFKKTGDISFNYYYRTKSYESMLDKCSRRGYKTNIKDIKKRIKDIGAMRIVTVFRDDIYKMVEVLRLFPGISIIDEDDYVTEPKDNGYSSYHLTVLVENMVGRELKKTPIEIQVRDNYMESWAQSEHEIFYKKNHRDDEAQAAMKQMADYLAEAAKLAMKLRDDMTIKRQAAAKANEQDALADDIIA